MQMITTRVEHEHRVANEINAFFAVFETTDFFQERAVDLETLSSEY